MNRTALLRSSTVLVLALFVAAGCGDSDGKSSSGSNPGGLLPSTTTSSTDDDATDTDRNGRDEDDSSARDDDRGRDDSDADAGNSRSDRDDDDDRPSADRLDSGGSSNIETATFDRWDGDESWDELGGRPAVWPEDLDLPESTERATLLEREGGDSVIMSGFSPDSRSSVESDIEREFEDWDREEAPDMADVLGAWERDDLQVLVTLRDSNQGDGTSFGYILRER